ncbi:MAG: magnesium/cobalt transporter CorA, partial [Betaproteobacteria bacterium]
MKRKRKLLRLLREPDRTPEPTAVEANLVVPPAGQAPHMTLIDYAADRVTEHEVFDPEQCAPFRHADSVTWVNVDGLHDTKKLEQLAKVMGFHALTLEDILNTDIRPKIEDYGDYVYFVAKMLDIDKATDQIHVDQLSLILGPGYVVSIQEEPGDPFGPLRSRIRNATGRLRRSAADYLAYALLDVVIDQYFVVADWISERIEKLDEQVAAEERADLMQNLYAIKRAVIFLRKSILPLRDVVFTLRNLDSDLIRESTAPYLRDLYDHIVQVSDRIETSRDLLSGLQDVYLSTLSNRTNTVMKIVAVFSSIFLPLTFITGVFGMNFEFMPLIHRSWGFALSVISMLSIVAAMLCYFRYK